MPGLDKRSVKTEIVDAFQEGIAPSKKAVAEAAEQRLNGLLKLPYQENAVQIKQHAKVMTELTALNIPGNQYLSIPVARKIADVMNDNISQIYAALNDKKLLQQEQVVQPHLRRKF